MNFLRLKGTTRARDIVDDRDGGLAGREVDHWDDRVSATAFTRDVRVHVPEHGLLFPGIGLLVPGDVAGFRHGRPVKVIAGGAWTVSGLFITNWIDLLDATQLAIDTSLTTHKFAMYDNTETPNFSTGVSYAATNEVVGTGYTAGGQTIVSPTTTESPAGSVMYDTADQVWASPTTVTAYGAKLYADALAANNLIFGVYFGAAVTSTASTFTIAPAATGWFAIDGTP